VQSARNRHGGYTTLTCNQRQWYTYACQRSPTTGGPFLDVVNLSAILSRSAVARQFAAGAPAARRWAAPCSALPPAAAAFDFAVLTFAALAGEIVYRRPAPGESSDFGGLNDGLLAGTLFVLLAQLAGLYRLPTLLAPSASLPRLI
jgi:hypothetical protein